MKILQFYRAYTSKAQTKIIDKLLDGWVVAEVIVDESLDEKEYYMLNMSNGDQKYKRVKFDKRTFNSLYKMKILNTIVHVSRSETHYHSK